MRTIEVTLYTYDDLTEREQLQAIESLRSAAVPKNWMDSIIMDADAIEVRLTKNLIALDGQMEAEVRCGVFDTLQAIAERYEEGSLHDMAKTWDAVFQQQWEDWKEVENAADGCDEVPEYEDSELYKATRRAFEIALQDHFNRAIAIERLRINSRQYIEDYIRENKYEFDQHGELYGN